MADEWLDIDRVSKRYGDVVALTDLTFDVRAGGLFGFVGSNGAGKTTAMRIILGVLSADAGEVRWGGRPLSLETRRQIGYMPEERGLYPTMKVGEQLTYRARLYGVPADAARRSVATWTERLGVAGRVGDEVQKLSLGNQQRVQLAASLLHDPRILVLDEPFSGLDPVAVDVMSRVLREKADEGSRWSSPATSWTSWSGSATASASSAVDRWWPSVRSTSCGRATSPGWGSSRRRRRRDGRTACRVCGRHPIWTVRRW
jgi:ABC-2 type transport system ATP-binding protein